MIDAATTQAHIDELEGIRKQINLWRGASIAVMVGTLVVCGWLVWSDARALMHNDATQQVFVKDLQSGLNENVIPKVREAAGQTLTEMQPVVQKEFRKLNNRVPEVTQATLKQVDELQRTLPDQSAKVLTEAFDQSIRSREDKIRQMFPNATEDQVKTLFNNLGQMVSTHSEQLSHDLLTPHLNEMDRIQANLRQIEKSEPATPTDQTADWQMGLAVFDIVRDDLKSLAPTPAKVPATKANKGAEVKS